jgi:hypothetical protein
MDIPSYYDNSYLNAISTPLDTGIMKMTTSGLSDYYTAVVDNSMPSITLDETEFNVRQIILKDLIIKILNIGKDYRSTTFFNSQPDHLCFTQEYHVCGNTLKITIDDQYIIYNDKKYPIENLIKQPLFERNLLIRIKQDLYLFNMVNC